MAVVMKERVWNMCLKCLCVLREDWIWEDTDTSKPNEVGAMVWSGTCAQSFVEEFRPNWGAGKQVKKESKTKDIFTLILLSYYLKQIFLTIWKLFGTHSLPIINCADCNCSENEACFINLRISSWTALSAVIKNPSLFPWKEAHWGWWHDSHSWGRSKPQKC